MATATKPNEVDNLPAKTDKKDSTPPREYRVVSDEGPIAHLMDTARFEHLQRIATVMAGASLIPDHLKGRDNAQTLGNCFLVVNQSLRWGLDPFAVAAETYSVQGKLGFQGKLIAALVNARARLVGRLRYDFDGEGDGRTVTVTGRFEGEDIDRSIELSVGQAKTANKMWAQDPDQKLIYSGVTKWARRHCPEILLGVLTDDDLERMAENRRIAGGPSNEVGSLGELTAKLSGEPVGTVNEVRSSGEAADDTPEKAPEVESEADAFDWDNFYLEVNALLDGKNTIGGVDDAQTWALSVCQKQGGGTDVEGQVRTMCDARRNEIRESKPAKGSK